ncbi:MAG: type II secretion system minor pseudopilin GspJ [Litorilituus sp.]|nr:type II secretion system minor pseudopilin GspJ [Litorilituus sp.]
MSKIKGFTLLEVLIAIAIFSVISLSSVTIFDSVIKGDESSQLRSERHNELQRAFLIIERDLTQIARRSIRINGEAPLKTFLQSASDAVEGEQAIGFVRHGWTNPRLLLPRSDMQAVAYQLNDETLQRLHFNFVDSVGGEEPKVRPLISKVLRVGFEYFDGKKWQQVWAGDDLPLAIAIEIETTDYGVIRRHFLVPGIDNTVKKKDSGGSA